MPSKSKAQHNFMAAVANNPQFARRAGVPQSVGREYMKADEGRSFKKGGDLVSNCGTKRMKRGGRASMDTGSRNMTMRKVDTESGIPVLVPPRMNYGGKVKGMKEGGMCRGYGRARGNKPVMYS